MTNIPHITRCGLPGIDRVPFGMHACHFYRDRDQLVAALVPYFVAGLRGNERSLWVTAPPLSARDAVRALRAAWDDVDNAVKAGALRILDASRLKGRDVVQFWLDEEERALAEGYNGLRIAGNIGFLAPDDWPTLMRHEQAAAARFSGRRIVVLCSYALAQCNDQQGRDVMRAHHCALEGPDIDGQVVAVSQFRAGLR